MPQLQRFTVVDPTIRETVIANVYCKFGTQPPISIHVIVMYNSTNNYICLCQIQLKRQHAKSDVVAKATWFTVSSSKKYNLGSQLKNTTSS